MDLIISYISKKYWFIGRILKEIRNFMDEKGYMEVETPMLTTVATGDAARPFVTHHNTLNLQMYLRIAPELNLKRLIVGGIDKVFEIGKNFRNEGMDIKHNPEFTNMEFYSAYEDYHDMMNITEEMFSRIAMKVKGSYKFSYQGQELDFTPGGWKKITIWEARWYIAGIFIYRLKARSRLTSTSRRLPGSRHP